MQDRAALIDEILRLQQEIDSKGCRTGYDWNADPESLTLAQGRVFELLKQLREMGETAKAQSGVAMIAAERERQVNEEGWTPEHDAQHVDQSLAMAAALYATPVPLFVVTCEGRNDGGMYVEASDPWPWKMKYDQDRGGVVNAWDKRDKHDRLRRLVIAGALIAAEIDRMKAAGEG